MTSTATCAPFLSLPAGTLDELKQAIDEFPTIFDVDRCDERFLPLLAKLVGMQADGTRSPEYQRRRIREAVEIYRRKGTIPAIRRDLAALGWQGELEETFRSALRLNARSRVGRSKLPGLVFSLGVFRVLCKNQTNGLRQALVFHHPAGTRCFWLQLLDEYMDGGADMRFDQARFDPPDRAGLHGRSLCPGPLVPGFVPPPDQQAARPRIHAADQHGRNAARNRTGRGQGRPLSRPAGPHAAKPPDAQRPAAAQYEYEGRARLVLHTHLHRPGLPAGGAAIAVRPWQ